MINGEVKTWFQCTRLGTTANWPADRRSGVIQGSIDWLSGF